MQLSAIILTKNEEKNILDCLESLGGIDEIVIVDDNSNDRTIEVAKKFSEKVKICSRKLEGDFSAQRNFGISKATHEWILFIDADERLTPKFINELNTKIRSNVYEGFLIRRKDRMWGRVLKFGETGNIKLLRVAKKMVGKWEGKVHEIWHVEGEIGELNESIIHYPHPSVSEFLSEINAYSTIRAEELFKLGGKVNIISIIFYPIAKFFLNFVLKSGYKDGIQGLLLSLIMSMHSFLVRAKLWHLQSQRKLE